MLKTADRVKQTTITIGTGTLDLDASIPVGFRGFVAAIGNGNTCYYSIQTTTTDWEVGVGTVTSGSPDTLSRDSVLASSNADNLVVLGAGTKQVFVTIPADIVVPYNNATKNIDVGANSFTTSTGIITPKIYPASDSTTAFAILKADGLTNILNVDTTNSRVGIGTTSPSVAFEIGSTTAGQNAKITATLGSDIAPALTGNSGVNWTLSSTTGYTQPFASTIDKTGNGTGTITTTAATAIVAGTTYKVVITISAISGSSATYTLGGVAGSILSTATTYTDYITASTTGKIIITPISTYLRITITSITIQVLTHDTGNLTVDGSLVTNTPASVNTLGIGTLTPATRFHLAGHTSLDNARIDTGITLSTVARPPAFTAVPAGLGAGNVNTGDHYYYLSYRTAQGETELTRTNGGQTYGGNVSTVTTTTAGDGQVRVSVTASTDYRVNGIKVYRSTTNGVSYACYLVTTIPNVTGDWIDNISDANRENSTTSAFSRDNTTNSQIYIGSNKGMTIGLTNTIVGTGAGNVLTTGGYNVFIGDSAGKGITDGSGNIILGTSTCQTNVNFSVYIGQWAGFANAGSSSIGIGFASLNYSGSNNIAIGYVAGNTPNWQNATGSNNVFLGSNSARSNITGSNHLFLGYYSGYYETGTQKLIIDTLNRTTESLGRAQSLLYGTFNATVSSQSLTINAGNTYIADTGTLGTEKLTNGTFTGASTGWTLGAVWKYGYKFTVSGVTISPTNGATYTNNGVTYTVIYTNIAAGAGSIYATGASDPQASGVLTWVSGTGDQPTITYSAFATNIVFKGIDGVTTLSQTSAAMAIPLVIGEMYYLSYTISNWTVGTVTPTCGGITLPISSAANGTYTAMFVVTSTADLVFTPTNTARFTIDDISLKKVTGGILQTGGNILVGGTVGTSTIKTDTGTPTDLTITTGAQKTLVLTTPVYDDIVIQAYNLRGGASPPTYSAFTTNIYGSRFINANTDIVYGSFELPHSYKEGTDLEIHLHWSPSTTDTGDCVWSYVYSLANMNETFSAEATITMTQAGSGIVNRHQYVSGSTTISGSTLHIGAIVVFALSRPTGDGFTGDAFLHSVGCHYQIDTLGSRQEGIK